MNFEPKKYTIDDLNGAVNDDLEKPAIGGGVWGSVNTGNAGDMQEKLAKMAEMKKQQAAQF